MAKQRSPQGASGPQQARNTHVGFALLTGVLVVLAMTSNIPSPMYVLYEARFHFRPDMTTVVFAVYATGALMALLCLGRASDHLGRRPVLAATICGAAVSALLFLSADGLVWLIVARIVAGVSVALAVTTAAAALSELIPSGDPQRAATISGVASLCGFGLGPLYSGLVMDAAPAPMQSAYALYLGLLLIAAVVLAFVPETVDAQDGTWAVRPTVTLPSRRREFWPAAAGAFSAFFLQGFFAALVPSLLVHELHSRRHLLGGAMVFLLFATAAVTQIATRSLTDRRALAAGLVAQPIGLAVLVPAIAAARLVVFVIGTLICGAACGLAFRGAQGTVNRIAPPTQRAGVISALWVAAYLGFSLPVVAVGIISVHFGALHTVMGAACLFAIVGVGATAATRVAPAQSPRSR
ncbi:MFS transporter (plasmid) [Streptomyces sp. CA-142005]|uniref:MFS transporter n=1 Tax=Streptomyces sp. CA-142005 TaxID=3240052 RepID=UPI003D9243EE